MASFVEDYNVIGAVAGEGRKVKVWVNTGRDQINIINNMVNDEFTPATGINVQLELVQGSLIESTLAGKEPDVALMIASDQPVNYAIRGALVDLSQFGRRILTETARTRSTALPMFIRDTAARTSRDLRSR